uniref:ABC transporter substrate-binding protein n=1 Tax=Sphingomonas bacterium TaxID=1895847 RepID=UPI0026121B65|nr:ABC transporter substrate-binding protein [Sphingomonas bacterium]
MARAALLLLGWTLLSAAAAAPLPRGYPRSYRQIMANAASERALLVYSTINGGDVADLLKEFRAAYPGVRLEYRELSSTALYRTFVDEVRAGKPTADLLWSAAMDLQTKLVNDGYAQAYASPEKPYLPEWAVWKNQAYGVTAEPIVFAYNRKIVPPADVPHTHADLIRLLRAKRAFYTGRMATYDPVRSSVGYLYMSQDLQLNRDTSALMKMLGVTKVSLFDSSSNVLDALSSGKQLIGYNVIGSYALERQAHDPSIGVVMPTDYTLVTSRVALIASEARHPNAAKLFLDFLLSRRGQFLLSRRYITPARADVPSHAGARAPAPIARAIRVGPALIANLDQIKRRHFANEWAAALATTNF